MGLSVCLSVTSLLQRVQTICSKEIKETSRNAISKQKRSKKLLGLYFIHRVPWSAIYMGNFTLCWYIYVLRSGAQYIMRDEAPIVNVYKFSSIIKYFLRICWGDTSELCRNTSNRTCRKAPNISMIQTLSFQMSSAEKHYCGMTELQRKKHGFVYLYAKIADLNKNNKIFKSLKPYVMKLWQIHLLHLRKYETKNILSKRINAGYLEWVSWKQSVIVLYQYYATEHVEKHRVSAWSMKQTLNFKMLSAEKHCNINQIS
jgi:hypothetical protein